MPYKLMRQTITIASYMSTNWKYADQARWLGFVLFYAVLLNIPFWTASRWLSLLPLGWFCIEYAVVGLLALFLPRMATGALLLLAIAADLISAVSKTYYLSPAECLRNFSSLRDLSVSRLAAAVTIGILIFALVGTAILISPGKIRGHARFRAALCLAVFICSALAMDYISASRDLGHFGNPLRSFRPSDTNRFSDTQNMWIGRYPVLRLDRDQRLFGSRRSLVISHISDWDLTPSASAVGVDRMDRPMGDGADWRPNVVVVLLESWGIHLDSSMRDLLVHSYSSPALLARYRVSQGTVPFSGSTVSGEARELCSSTIGMQILDISSADARLCLPGRVAKAGYHTLALHGMAGHMFRRSDWYGTIGFQERWFREGFRQQGLPDCVGAFVGICDASISEWIGHRLAKNEAHPDFVYWVTLNSHLPVRVPSALSGDASCAVLPLLATEPPLCSWYQLVENVHRSVAQLAMTSLARPTIFVVVGDHAPPFANPTLRGQFSSTEVPYIVLLPRVNVLPQMQTATVQGAVPNRKPL